jgi:hypothetical protein
MLQPITVVTADDILNYVGINLDSALVSDDSPGNKTERYIRDVTFLIENHIKSLVYNGVKVIEQYEDVIKTCVCYQVEYQKRNGELQKYALVNVEQLSVGNINELQRFVISPEVHRILLTEGIIYRGFR